MKFIAYGSEVTDTTIAILIKETALNRTKILTHYIVPTSIDPSKFLACGLVYDKPKICSAAMAKEHLDILLIEIDKLGIQTIMVCDAIYFKYLTGNKKADPFYGYVCPCKIAGFEHIQVILAPNYQALYFNPNIQEKLDYCVNVLVRHVSGTYRPPGQGIIHSAYYPETVQDIQNTFNKLKQYPALACDIETKGLEFWNCGISTISFAWNKHEGVAFAVDRGAYSSEVRRMLKEFFETYTGTLIWHNIGFDAKVQIYQLWMQNLADYEGLLTGLGVMTRRFEDTKLIAYLATNNAVENILGLKPLSAEFTGNYSVEEIKETDRIPLPELLEYNLIDCLATWYVYEKYYPIMVEDEQEDLYQNLLKPTVKTLLQTELCGLPINPDKVQAAKKELITIEQQHLDFFKQSPIIQDFHYQQQQELVGKKTVKAKKKVYSLDDPLIQRFQFNPGSDTQIRKLLFEYLGLPVLELTKVKQASTSGKVLKNLVHHTKNAQYIEIIEHLCGLTDVSKILSTFITAFENAQQLPDGSYRLYGNFSLGGTQSLRLSSSNP